MVKALVQEEVKRVTVSNRIDEKLYRRLKYASLDEKRELYLILEDAIRRYLDSKTTTSRKEE